MIDEIGIRIRRLRERAKVSGRELARCVGSAQSYISKIESGKIRPSRSFCVNVARALKLDEHERVELLNLVSLFRAEHYPLSKEQTALRRRQRAIHRLEESCFEFRVYQPVVIPGLLQTRQYMTAIFRHYTQNEGELLETTDKRLGRQRALNNKHRSFRFLIHESALLSMIVGRKVMDEQIEQLIQLSGSPNIGIRLLPLGVEIPVTVKIPMAGFEILDQSLVIMDTLIGYTTFRHPDDVANHVATFDRLYEMALGGSALIQKLRTRSCK